MNVHLVRLDPYDPNLGLLVPIVGKRIMAYAAEHQKELDPVAVAQSVMVPLYSRDPFTLVLAMVSPEGTVMGHAVGAINTDGTRHTLTITQTQADGAVGDAVLRALDYAKEWVAKVVNPLLATRGFNPVQKMVLVTGKNAKAWESDYGFKLERRILGLTLTSGEEGSDSE